MFFERRRWARRIVDRVCVNMHSQEATLLVHMIIWAAKHMPAKASKREAVIMAAIGMAANQTAIARVAEELVVPPDVAQRFLARIHGAAVALARENGMQAVEERGHAGGDALQGQPRLAATAHRSQQIAPSGVSDADTARTFIEACKPNVLWSVQNAPQRRRWEGHVSKSSSAVVLIVEDDVLSRATTASSLRDCGFEVYEAATAAEAVAILNTVAVDALISDVNMPRKIDGLALASWVRQQEPDTKVILTSADKQSSGEAKEYACYLFKPYNDNEIHQLLMKMLSH
jgi:CheY-like chemotaxis protein